MGSKEFVEYVVPWLVDYPDEVQITEATSANGGLIYELEVNPEDMGKVIGKRGRIIRSLRALARAASQGEELPASVELVD